MRGWMPMRGWMWWLLGGLVFLAPAGLAVPAAASLAVHSGPGVSAVAAAAPRAGALTRAEPGGVAQAVPGKPVCTIEDERLTSLSGMGATAAGYVMINDFTGSSRSDRVFFLDKGCKVGSRTVTYPSGPRDPEDLAVGKDGTVWVADIGDNNKQRTSIALWKVPATGGTQAVLYRLRYPDGRHDAEALLLDANDQPIIVTKEPGVSHIFVPTAPIVPASANSQGVPLRKVGEFRPQRTGTSTPLAFIGQIQVTGGASSPDRTKVVLRTYSDAYEWDVPDGDVVKAITTGKPRITPLPDEPWGEAITYSTDGRSLLTVSETENLPADERPRILQYTPSSDAGPTAAGGAAPARRNTLSWFERLSLTEATSLIAGVGALGVLMVAVGVVGILRARNRPTRARAGEGTPEPVGDREPAAVAAGLYGQPDYDGGHPADPGYPAETGYPPETGYRPDGGNRQGGAGYGGAGYRGSAAGGTARGTVYGGGAVYGSGAAGHGGGPGQVGGPGQGVGGHGGVGGQVGVGDGGSGSHPDPEGYGPPAGYPRQRGR